eukprot:TRINITY_DN110914_c0_g1_i1.p1 TRINITY_DN110914_c0_g1~~TRINITY_DN110914_c0_g1_i1.p1  ORF type:complete len:463 (+),score=43.73 TRINITY_DN110914_c0_g1_i1:92-1480(+)
MSSVAGTPPITRLRRSISDLSAISEDREGPPPRHRWIFALVCLELFSGQFAFAVFAPFFPQEAASKGMSPAVLGWVFGIFQVVVVLFTPITLRLVPSLGPRALLHAANFITGLSSLAFGLTWYAREGTQFTVLCFAVRMIAATGVSIQMVVGYGLLPYLFKEGVSAAAGILETVIGLAFTIAPVAGSWLYILGGGAEGTGYVLPWYVLGTVQLVLGFFMLVALPSLPSPPNEPADMTRFSPMVIIPCIICVVSAAAIEFIAPTIQPYLAGAPFNYSVQTVGLVFAVCSLVYSAAGPLTGFLDDWTGGKCSFIIMAVGLLITGVGYTALGPADWLEDAAGLKPGPTGVWTGVGLIGVGTALALIPTYHSILVFAKHPDEHSRSTATSGLYNAVYGCGAFLGPTLGGSLGESIGVANSYTDCGVFCVLFAIVVLLFARAAQKPAPVHARSALIEPLAPSAVGHA